MEKILKNILTRINTYLDKLAFVRLKKYNLVEPYTLEHLKKMIHSVTADYSKFKYKPFLVELKALKELGKSNIKLIIPFLIDCINMDDAEKLVTNICKKLAQNEYYTLSDKDIFTKEEPNIKLSNNDELVNSIQRMLDLGEYQSFENHVQKLIDKVKNSQHFLTIDLLSGTSRFKTVKLPIDSYKPNYPGLQIAVEIVEIAEPTDE